MLLFSWVNEDCIEDIVYGDNGEDKLCLCVYLLCRTIFCIYLLYRTIPNIVFPSYFKFLFKIYECFGSTYHLLGHWCAINSIGYVMHLVEIARAIGGC